MSLQLKNIFNSLTKSIMLLFLIALTSCSEINTTDPKDTYKYWEGTDPSSAIKLLNGLYWQSAHWTGEYIVYLKFKASDKWWEKFLKKKHLSTDKTNWTIPTDAPRWFKPSANAIRYMAVDDFDQGSRYFRIPNTQICYIYEIQL
jgi:hypothetical protein